MNPPLRLLACLVLLLPVACGGGGGDAPRPADDAPPPMPGPDGTVAPPPSPIPSPAPDTTPGPVDPPGPDTPSGPGTPPGPGAGSPMVPTGPDPGTAPGPGGPEPTAPGPDGEPPEDCSVAGVNEWVDAAMRDYYLYYDRVPLLNLADYEAPEPLVRDLRVEPPDRFSNIGDAEQQATLFDEGRQFGYGFELRFDEGGALRFADVVVRSPMDGAGVARGDILRAIDGVTIDELEALDPGARDARYAELLGVPPESRSPTFRIESGADGRLRDVTVTSREYDLVTVPFGQTLEIDGVVYGYLPFLLFLETSPRELDEQFAFFVERGVTELILDLRYNGGGRTSVAHHLASLIAGRDVFGQPLEIVEANDRYPERGFTEPFPEVGPSLDLARVAVIATGDTASSSEIVINGLAPYVDVDVIGTRTTGKPFQSRGRDYCGRRLNAVEFISTNAAGASVVDGVAPVCEVADDLAVPFGDPDEGMLDAALTWLREGVCPSAVPMAAARARPAAAPAVARAPIGDAEPPPLPALID